MVPINPESPEPRPVLTGSRRRRHRSAFPPGVLLGILVILVAAVSGTWYWLRSRQAPEPTPLVGVETDSVQVPDEGEPFVLPTLDASDAVVRGLATGVLSNPTLAEWLVTDDLIRRFVEAVVDISRGSSPVPALAVMVPDEPVTVRPSGDHLVMDPRSYRRYDALGDVFASLDPRDAANVYRRLLPLFQEAYLEIGLPDGDFQDVLARAIQNLLAVEVPEGPFRVREAVGRYVYEDESIEALTPAQKHLYRLGPENARKVQEKLREIALELGLTPGA